MGINTAKIALFGVLGLLALILSFSVVYIVPEGHIAVVKNFGRADRMEGPGIHIKTPFVETLERIEIRERKNVEEMSVATANQLPATAVVSINWTVNREAAMALFIQYGGLAQFEERVLDPRMRSASKAAIARFPADKIIRERQLVVAEIQRQMSDVVQDLPISISQAQLENIDLPRTYMDAVLAKEQAREQAARESHNLERQRLQSLQQVNTAEAAKRSAILAAEAQKQSAILHAQGRADAIRLEAEAEAQAIKVVTAELIGSPRYIELVRAKSWNGQLPSTLLSDEASGVLLSLGQ